MDLYSKENSIYQQIGVLYDQYPKTPYMFQDVHFDGKISVIHYFFEKIMPNHAKDLLVLEVTECITSMMVDEELPYDLLEAVHSQLHYAYADRLVDRVQLLLNNGVWERSKTYALGMRLAKEGVDIPSVITGILILGAFENDVVMSVLRKLGLHSMFTLYVILATRNWEKANHIVYDLAQNTIGYGKFAAISFLVPLSQSQKNWMFYKGASNRVLQSISAMTCVAKADMQEYFRNKKVSKENFSAFSYHFAYAMEEDNPLVGLIEERLLREYIERAIHEAASFIDFAALVSIKQSARATDETTTVKRSDIYRACSKLINQKKWKQILLNELAQPSQSSSLIIKALGEYEDSCYPRKPYHLTLNDFIPLLTYNDPYDMDVMYYLLQDKHAPRWEEVFQVFAHQLPGGILEGGPQIIEEEDITPEFKPDVWLVLLLQAMARSSNEMDPTMLDAAEHFYISCLEARFQEVRKEAVSALRSIKSRWGNHTEDRLENHLKTEPDENVKKRIRRLLGLKTHSKKEQRYVDVSGVAVEPNPTDIVLLYTTIAGAFYRDMSLVEEEVSYGDVLFLKPEPENKYDSNAILITADDGYVLGYIPREENVVLGQRIEQGEKLYAILCDELDTYAGRPFIEVWLSLESRKEDNIILLPCFS